MSAPLNSKDQSKSPLEGGPSFPLKHRIIRLVWNLVWTVFASWTPPFMWRWRRFLLVSFGAKMASSSDVRGSARVWYPPNLIMEHGALMAERVNCYNMNFIKLGLGALVSQGAYLCGGGHNIDDPDFQLITKPIDIAAGAWIASEAFVGPGVRVGNDAVLGARAVTFRDVPDNEVWTGNPASRIRDRRQSDT